MTKFFSWLAENQIHVDDGENKNVCVIACLRACARVCACVHVCVHMRACKYACIYACGTTDYFLMPPGISIKGCAHWSYGLFLGLSVGPSVRQSVMLNGTFTVQK